MSNDSSIYYRLGQAITTMPNLNNYPYASATLDWIAEVQALVDSTGKIAAITELNSLVNFLYMNSMREKSVGKIYVLLKRTLVSLEMKLPAGLQGAFIPAGNVHDALTGVGKALATATQDLLIIDPYLDEKVMEFIGQAKETVTIRLLADAKSHKPSFKPAVTRWTQQWASKWPVEARLAPAGTLHDRLIVIDETEVYALGQSFNALAVRAHTSLVRASTEVAQEKVSAYRTIWASAAL